MAAKGIALHDPGIKEAIKAQCWKKFNKPSMQQHIEAGKRTEIDALNGAVLRLAREVGVPVPFNEALTMLIKGREKSQRQLLHEPPIDYAAMEQDAASTTAPRFNGGLGCDLLDQPGHVSTQVDHGLDALIVLLDFALGAAEGDVPIARPDGDHLGDAEIVVQAVEGVHRAPPVAPPLRRRRPCGATGRRWLG